MDEMTLFNSSLDFIRSGEYSKILGVIIVFTISNNFRKILNGVDDICSWFKSKIFNYKLSHNQMVIGFKIQLAKDITSLKQECDAGNVSIIALGNGNGEKSKKLQISSVIKSSTQSEDYLSYEQFYIKNSVLLEAFDDSMTNQKEAINISGEVLPYELSLTDTNEETSDVLIYHLDCYDDHDYFVIIKDPKKVINMKTLYSLKKFMSKLNKL